MYSKALRLRSGIRKTNLVQKLQSYGTASSSWKVKDPFGLREEEDLEASIQGIYIKPPKPKSEDETVGTEGGNINSEAGAAVDEDRVYLESKFGRVSQTRSEKILASDVTAEAVYASSFGQIRFDKDNPVKYDGQFDEEHFRKPDAEQLNSLEAKKYGRDTGARGADLANQVKKGGGLNVEGSASSGEAKTEVEMTEIQKKDDGLKPFYEGSSGETGVPSSPPPNPQTAAQFVRLMRLKEKQEKEAEIEFKVGGRPVSIPKTSVVIETKEHVPKIYKPFDWQDTTREDVWVYLRKQICFENEFLVALNKPQGLPMHSATVTCRHTVIDFLQEFADHCRVKQIYPCHRLDKDTTGVLLLAKSEQAAAAIKAKFANRSIIKQYFAIVKNCPPMREGTIKIPIGEGKIPNSDNFRAVLKPDLEKFNITTMQKNCMEATTWFKVLKSQSFGAFLEVRPETGLTHQIRVHLAHALSCPILGDHKYSHREKMAPQRLHTEMLDRLKVKQSKVRHIPLHLHCSKLQFTMPDGFMSKNFHEPIFVHAKLPYFFLSSLKALGFR